MWDLAAVKPVLKDQIKRPTGKLLAAIFGAVGPHAALALDPGGGMPPIHMPFFLEAARDHVFTALRAHA